MEKCLNNKITAKKENKRKPAKIAAAFSRAARSLTQETTAVRMPQKPAYIAMMQKMQQDLQDVLL